MEKFYYLTDISSIQLDDNNSAWIEIFRLGKWKHPSYGWIHGTKDMFQSFMDNWKNKILGREVAIDKNHKPEDGATGWIRDIKMEGDRLKAQVELTSWGKELVQEKGFIYFSPEFVDTYTSKEDPSKKFGPTLLGGALTLRPFLTGLAPVALSESMESSVKNYCLGTEADEEDDDSNILTESFDQVLDQMADEEKIDRNKLIDSLTT